MQPLYFLVFCKLDFTNPFWFLFVFFVYLYFCIFVKLLLQVLSVQSVSQTLSNFFWIFFLYFYFFLPGCFLQILSDSCLHFCNFLSGYFCKPSLCSPGPVTAPTRLAVAGPKVLIATHPTNKSILKMFIFCNLKCVISTFVFLSKGADRNSPNHKWVNFEMCIFCISKYVFLYLCIFVQRCWSQVTQSQMSQEYFQWVSFILFQNVLVIISQKKMPARKFDWHVQVNKKSALHFSEHAGKIVSGSHQNYNHNWAKLWLCDHFCM